MSQQVMKPQSSNITAETMEKVLLQGNLTTMNSTQRLEYYKAVCESVGLNPLTRPFEYISLQGKLTLYAKRECTEQLRKIYGISIKILSRERLEGVYIVTAQATDSSGRVDESIGAVNISKLQGEALATAIMKAETKAKRRVTLSISGLGWLDETEVATIKGAELVDSKYITKEESQKLHIIQMKDCTKAIYDNELLYREKIKERGQVLDNILFAKGYETKNDKGYISTKYIEPEDYAEIKEELESEIAKIIEQEKKIMEGKQCQNQAEKLLED